MRSGRATRSQENCCNMVRFPRYNIVLHLDTNNANRTAEWCAAATSSSSAEPSSCCASSHRLPPLSLADGETLYVFVNVLNCAIVVKSPRCLRRRKTSRRVAARSTGGGGGTRLANNFCWRGVCLSSSALKIPCVSPSFASRYMTSNRPPLQMRWNMHSECT